MEQTTITFPSLQELWAFQKHARVRKYKFNMIDCTFQAVLTEDQIWDALTKFKGKVTGRQIIA